MTPSPLLPLSRPPARAALALLALGVLTSALVLPATPATESPRRASMRVEGLEVPALGRVNLDLVRLDLFTPDAQLLVDGRPGPLSPRLAATTFWRGAIRGGVGSEPGFAVLALSPDGGASGILSTGGRRFRLASGADGQLTAAPDEAWMPDGGIDPIRAPCAASEALAPFATARLRDRGGLAAEAAAKKLVYAPPGLLTATIAVESDYEMLERNLGDVERLQGKLAEFFAEISVVTHAELGLALQVGLISVWTTPNDPWSDTSEGVELLYEFKSYWQKNRPYSKFPRAAAHLVTGRPQIDVGGIAFVYAACSGPDKDPYDFGLSRTNAATIAHELGHNFGSLHTHCYEPPVDHCWSRQEGCYSGPESLPFDNGSLMSYCSDRVMTYGAPGKYGTASERVPQTLRAFIEEVYAGCLSHQTDPFELQAAEVTPTSVTLTWKDLFEGEKNWVVELQNGKTFRVAKSLPANATSITLTKLKPGKTLVYRLFAKFKGTESERSFTVAVTPQ